MDLTSPEHDALVALAVLYRRAGNIAGLTAVTEALRVTDAERYGTEHASPTCTFVIDRWDGCGWISDTAPSGRLAEIRANELNTRNIRDGARHLAEQLRAAVAGEVA